MSTRTEAAKDPGSAETAPSEIAHSPGSASVPGAGESVPLSRTSEQSPFRRDAETHARDGRAPRIEESRYWKRRLPHFEKPWTIYAVTATTRARRNLSPAARTIVLNALRYFHLDRYELFAACVMPDHVHFLFQPWPKEHGSDQAAIFWSISELTHSVKSFTAHEINKLEKTNGALWEEEIFDRYIRSESDLREKFRYICRNPWDSKVVSPDEDYRWIWTQEDELRDRKGDANDKDSGSELVPRAGESVPAPQSLEQSPFRRDAETHARDGRAPQMSAEVAPREAAQSPGSASVPGAGESVPRSRTSDEIPFRRDAETHARDERASRISS